MMIVLSPTYTIRIVVQDKITPPNPQVVIGQTMAPYRWYGAFGEKTGCDDLLKAVSDALATANIKAKVTLEKFEHSA